MRHPGLRAGGDQSGTFTPTCVDEQGNLDLLVYAVDGSEQAVAWAAITDQPAPAEGPTTTVSVSSWQTGFQSADWTIEALPPNLDSTTATLQVRHDGVPVGETQRAWNLSGGAPCTVELSRGVPDLRAAVRTQVNYEPGAAFPFALRAEDYGDLPASRTLQLEDAVHARTYGVTLSASDLRRPEASWQTDAAIQPRDLLVLDLYWDVDGDQKRWRLVRSPDTTSPVTFPELPAHVEAPAAASDYFLLRVQHVESSALDDYADAVGRFPPPAAEARLSEPGEVLQFSAALTAPSGLP